MKYNGIIFDFNGTLFLDSEKHYEAWLKYSKKLRGKSFTSDEMAKHMFGHSNEDIIAYAIGKKPTKTMVIKYGQEKEALYRDMCRHDRKNMHLTCGAEELFEFLKNNQVPMTIATMSDKKNVEFYIEEFGLNKWFDVTKIAYDDGEIKGKPEPDIFLRAAKNININPEECIVFEDALSGIEAARRAGVGKIVAVSSLHDEKFYQENSVADKVIKNFFEFDRTELKIKQ